MPVPWCADTGVETTIRATMSIERIIRYVFIALLLGLRICGSTVRLSRQTNLARVRPADQNSADLFRLFGREEKTAARSLLDTIQAEARLHDSSCRVRIVRQHQVAGFVGNHLAENQ